MCDNQCMFWFVLLYHEPRLEMRDMIKKYWDLRDGGGEIKYFVRSLCREKFKMLSFM